MKKGVILIIVIAIVVLAFVFFGKDYVFNLEERESEGKKGVETPQLYPASEELGGFCGSETRGACVGNDDCVRGGCSGQVCQSINEESIITTCEWNECYVASGVFCGCINNKCEWGKSS